MALAVKAFVFQPNEPPTWPLIKNMVSNFLTDIWKQGGLVGVKPSDAFYVNIGLNQSMTSQDIEDGMFRISFAVAVNKPAEFILINIQQKMHD
ncbi:hypothetical protein [Aliiglaciecola sp. LCG003]|uniref:hypothetical protein n=1 Tax=Aliiglaciecola sp. LCG003 TaxID=3053655 RepID=UPI0025744770|nr:hypothetical protein [Aliiglaciecola sp. LCG003]WJG11299.1 hypothetical protein QR722_10910 [Aliiglaciecola sp. LCG003]